jgi:hypothetical protein
VKTAVAIGAVHFVLVAAIGVVWALGPGYRSLAIVLGVAWVLSFLFVQSVVGRGARLAHLPRRIRRGLVLGAVALAIIAIVCWAVPFPTGQDQTPKRVVVGVLIWLTLGLALLSSSRVMSQAPAEPEPARSLREA